MPLINESGADVILSGHLHSFNPKRNSLPLYPADKDGINVPNVVNSNVDLMIVSANSKEIDISFIDSKGGKPREDIKLPVGNWCITEKFSPREYFFCGGHISKGRLVALKYLY